MRSRDCLKLYHDEEGVLKEEMEDMHGRNMFASFYDQIKSIRDFHRKYPHITVSHEPAMEKALEPDVHVRLHIFRYFLLYGFK